MKPKNTLAFLVVSALALSGAGPLAQSKVEFPAPSPSSTVQQRFGVTDVEVVYSRPGVKERRVFGDLVPFGEVWRTGANQATKLTFSTAVRFGGADVPAGSYGLFTIPGEKEWTIILNKVPGQWGSYRYDAKDDLVRVKATPQKLAEAVETFTIDVNDIRDESATLNLVWERTRVPVTLEVKLEAALVPQIEAAMASSDEKKPYAQAAMFYFDHGIDLKKAAVWMDEAIKAQPDAFYLIYRKGLILEKLGDKAGAMAAARQSHEMAGKTGGALGAEYTRLNEALIARLQ